WMAHARAAVARPERREDRGDPAAHPTPRARVGIASTRAQPTGPAPEAGHPRVLGHAPRRGQGDGWTGRDEVPWRALRAAHDHRAKDREEAHLAAARDPG